MKDIIEITREVFPNGSEIRSEPDGVYVEIPSAASAPLRPEEAIRREGHDIYVTGPFRTESEDTDQKFGIHPSK